MPISPEAIDGHVPLSMRPNLVVRKEIKKLEEICQWANYIIKLTPPSPLTVDKLLFTHPGIIRKFEWCHTGLL